MNIGTECYAIFEERELKLIPVKPLSEGIISERVKFHESMFNGPIALMEYANRAGLNIGRVPQQFGSQNLNILVFDDVKTAQYVAENIRKWENDQRFYAGRYVIS